MAWNAEREIRLREALREGWDLARLARAHRDAGLAAAFAMAADHPLSFADLEVLTALPQLSAHDAYLVALAAIAAGEPLAVPDGLEEILRADLAAQSFFHARSPTVRGACHVPFLFAQAIPIISGAIGPASGYFILDTGAPHTALSRTWWEQAGLPELRPGARQRIGDGAGNFTEADCVRIDGLTIGELVADGVPAVVFDFPEGLDLAGIISPLDSFPGHESRFDWGAGTVTIAPAAPGDDLQPIIWSGGNPAAQVAIDGQERLMMIDTGAGSCAMCIDDPLDALPATSLSALGPVAYGEQRARRLAWAQETLELGFVEKRCVEHLDRAVPPILDGLLGANLFFGRCLRISRFGWQLGSDARSCLAGERIEGR